MTRSATVLVCVRRLAITELCVLTTHFFVAPRDLLGLCPMQEVNRVTL